MPNWSFELHASEARKLARTAVRTPTLEEARNHIDSLISQSASVGVRRIINPLSKYVGPISRDEEALLWQEIREDGFEVIHDHQFPGYGAQHVHSVTSISW